MFLNIQAETWTKNIIGIKFCSVVISCVCLCFCGASTKLSDGVFFIQLLQLYHRQSRQTQEQHKNVFVRRPALVFPLTPFFSSHTGRWHRSCGQRWNLPGWFGAAVVGSCRRHLSHHHSQPRRGDQSEGVIPILFSSFPAFFPLRTFHLFFFFINFALFTQRLTNIVVITHKTTAEHLNILPDSTFCN